LAWMSELFNGTFNNERIIHGMSRYYRLIAWMSEWLRRQI
jgi:hypothetical protein